MSGARPIDLSSWPRREHFEHYRSRVPCSYAMTVELDVTALAGALGRSRHKSYVAQVWALARAVNRTPEFRMTLTAEGGPAVWDVVHPSFTVLNPQRETFCSVWTPFEPDFALFSERAAELLGRHRSATSMFPQGDPPANSFDVSSLPWTSFTGFSLQIGTGQDHLLPIFTLGRYREQGGRTLLPLAVQIHHAAADGFHTCRLLRELQTLVDEPGWVDAG